ncbi:hypothetical protein Enr10x_46690 [Gimesia panareensis]|uniref:Uncharacterized protein n=1 Tax=Gimesia panareensis TaxID=2527978 RepID=A0A517QCG9_9PLAN|nr:hypothetical protein Enr10x_46690 [Gimesia panareensis]
MFEHFIGKVYRFDDEPQQELPFVDFPLYSQDETTSESLLIQLDPEDLSEKSQQRLDERFENSPLPLSLLKENHGIEPESQIKLCNDIKRNFNKYYWLLNWSGFPKYEQLQKCCQLMWKYWINRGKNGVFSYKQLTLKIWKLSRQDSISSRVSSELIGDYKAESANEAVERVLSFDRNWAGFDFPQLLLALNRIQAFVYEDNGYDPGDYSYFAMMVENLFLPNVCSALDEFGIPINLSVKCDFLFEYNTLDDALKSLKKIDIQSLKLHPYERTLLENAQRGL